MGGFFDLFKFAATAIGSIFVADKASKTRKKQREAAQDAARGQAAVKATADATTRNKELAGIRQRVREERVRKAQIISASANLGASGSSGATSAQSNLGVNTSIAISGVGSAGKSRAGIDSGNSIIAGARKASATATAKQDLFAANVGLFTTGASTLFDPKGANLGGKVKDFFK